MPAKLLLCNFQVLSGSRGAFPLQGFGPRFRHHSKRVIGGILTGVLVLLTVFWVCEPCTCFTRSVHLRNHPRLYHVCWEFWRGPVLDWWQVTAADMIACLAHCRFHEGQQGGMLLTDWGAVPCLTHTSRRRLPADLLPRRRGFDRGPARARLVLKKVAVRQVSLRVLPFCPCQNHFNIASYTFYPLLQALYKLSNWHHR
jgi:hypothetical protein